MFQQLKKEAEDLAEKMKKSKQPVKVGNNGNLGKSRGLGRRVVLVELMEVNKKRVVTMGMVIKVVKNLKAMELKMGTPMVNMM